MTVLILFVLAAMAAPAMAEEMAGIDVGTGSDLAVRLVILAAIGERVVAQIKKVAGMQWTKPWPLIAVFVAGAGVFGFDLPLWEYIGGTAPVAHWAQLYDRLFLTLFLAGGSAAVVDTFKSINKRRDEMHKANVGAVPSAG